MTIDVARNYSQCTVCEIRFIGFTAFISWNIDIVFWLPARCITYSLHALFYIWHLATMRSSFINAETLQHKSISNLYTFHTLNILSNAFAKASRYSIPNQDILLKMHFQVDLHSNCSDNLRNEDIFLQWPPNNND